MKINPLVIFVLVAIVFVGANSMFTVDQREKAMVFRLGEIVTTDLEPGWHWKAPFINNVRKFDGRLQTLDSRPERFLTSEKKNVIVDTVIHAKLIHGLISSLKKVCGGLSVRKRSSS